MTRGNMLSDTLIARALSCEGLSYGDPSTQRAYLLHQYPGDRTAAGEPDANARQMGERQTGCLLTVRGNLAADEVDGTISWRGAPLDVLRCSYALPGVLSFVETLLVQLGRQRGLLVDHGPELAALELADVVLIGQGGQAPSDEGERAKWRAAWGGLAHGFLVTGLSTDGQGRTLVESIDGGQIDPRNGGRCTAIRRVTRRLEMRGGNPWLVSSDGGARRIGWRLRAGALPCRP
jgi:hypothetical protein